MPVLTLRDPIGNEGGGGCAESFEISSGIALRAAQSMRRCD